MKATTPSPMLLVIGCQDGYTKNCKSRNVEALQQILIYFGSSSSKSYRSDKCDNDTDNNKPPSREELTISISESALPAHVTTPNNNHLKRTKVDFSTCPINKWKWDARMDKGQLVGNSKMKTVPLEVVIEISCEN